MTNQPEQEEWVTELWRKSREAAHHNSVTQVVETSFAEQLVLSEKSKSYQQGREEMREEMVKIVEEMKSPLHSKPIQDTLDPEERKMLKVVFENIKKNLISRLRQSGKEKP